MKLVLSLITWCFLLSPSPLFADDGVALSDLQRAIALTDATMATSFVGGDSDLRMYDTYNTATKSGSGTADVWPYTAALEAHCSVLEALELLKEEAPELYDSTHDRFVTRLGVLYDNLAYYRGSYTLVSYASRRNWKIYGVHRGGSKGTATVTGIENVYDDQMWICRELVRAYRLTGEKRYLSQATNLADYCIDGWDCCLDADGNEYGGITWGPGYNSKHSCSNGPFIQPLVWLAEAYRTDDEEANMRHYYILPDCTRTTELRLHSDIYLDFAKKIYVWQKKMLLNKSKGVYYDMLGAPGEIKYVNVGGREYRDHVDTGNPGGTAYTYNSGTMLAGAAELYRVTGEADYLTDLDALCRSCFTQFAKVRRLGGIVYREWPTDEVATSGFNTWFDDVLMRAYVEAHPYNTSSQSQTALISFQQNLDYAWENHLIDGLLPIHLLDGWEGETVTKGFHQFAFASELAMLAVWHYRQGHPDSINSPQARPSTSPVTSYYDLQGHPIQPPFRPGIYLSQGRKVAVR
ncbi:MAG: glycoside hydrolase family 76 protein [Bacteroidaceae bacterium]|nr:glycoside hydrolase family 76 protein [Bacteroidaceae bacterium]